MLKEHTVSILYQAMSKTMTVNVFVQHAVSNMGLSFALRVQRRHWETWICVAMAVWI